MRPNEARNIITVSMVILAISVFAAQAQWLNVSAWIQEHVTNPGSEDPTHGGRGTTINGKFYPLSDVNGNKVGLLGIPG